MFKDEVVMQSLDGVGPATAVISKYVTLLRQVIDSPILVNPPPWFKVRHVYKTRPL